MLTQSRIARLALVFIAAVLLFTILPAYKFIGNLVELEYPYRRFVKRIELTRISPGLTARAYFADCLDTDQSDVHFHTCSYCESALDNNGSMLLFWVNYKNQSRHIGYCFVYDKNLNRIYPGSAESLAKFPELTSEGILLSPAGVHFGDVEVLVPVEQER